MENNCRCRENGCPDELLCRYSRTKEPELRDKIFEKYSYLAEIITKKYVNKGVEYDDLYQVASLGLLIAIDRFDCGRGVRFSTFATPTIMGEIRRYFRDKGFIIKLPRKLYEIFRKADRIRTSSEREGASVPTADELAAVLQVTDRDVRESLKLADIMNMVSLEETVCGNGADLSRVIGVEDDSFLIIENRDFICESLRRLDTEEKKLIFQRYYKGKTQKETAKILGISQMQVSRKERKALEKLKKMYEK